MTNALPLCPPPCPHSLGRRLLFGAALAVAPLIFSLPPAQAGDGVVDFAPEHAEMNAAMDQAVATLPLFLSHVFDANGTGDRQAELKVAYETQQGGYTEIIWVDNLHMLKEGRFAGRFANEPNYIVGKHLGDQAEFGREDIRDWGLWRDGKLWGHYTTRVIVTQLEGQQQAEIEQMLSPTAVPNAWSTQ